MTVPPVELTAAKRPLWHLIVGFLAIVAALGWLGGWPLPFVIFAILAMIMFHEFGHYLTARWSGMKSTEFFVGFGPRLWSRQRGETEWGVKAIPLGGYVKILGMTSAEVVDSADEARTYRQQSFPKRVLVASAGSIMHLILAMILVFASVAMFGTVLRNQVSVGKVATFVGVVTPARAAGLQPGDVLVAIDGHRIGTDGNFQLKRSQIGHPVIIQVRRHVELLNLTATPVDGRHVHLAGKDKPYLSGNQATPVIGIDLKQTTIYQHHSVLGAIPASLSESWRMVSLTGQALGHIFSPSGFAGIFHLVTNSKAATNSATNPTAATNRPTSIFGIVRVAIQVAHDNPAGLFYLFAAVNIAIGMVNMLPMLPLDGGHVAIAVYERVRTRRGRPRYVADPNKLLPVVYVFVAVLFVVFLSALYLDITHPINL